MSHTAEMNEINIDVVSYPSDDSVLSNTINTLEDLKRRLSVDYGVHFPVRFSSLAKHSPDWAFLLNEVLGASFVREVILVVS
jgi:hypothetical protein